MIIRSAVAGLVGAAMLALPLDSASAFTLSSPSLDKTVGAGQVDKVWWRGGWGWRGGGWRAGWGYRRWGWGYRPWGWGYRPWGWGGPFVAGAVVGAAAAAPYYYGGCWRRVWGPWGWHWARVC